MIRLLNLCVIAALVFAAAYVYKIKFDSTLQAERVAKLRSEIRRERDTIAGLRAQWSKLDAPARIEGLAKRHLQLRRIDVRQFDTLDHLPERAADLPLAGPADPIGAMLEQPAIADGPTGSIAAPGRGR